MYGPKITAPSCVYPAHPVQQAVNAAIARLAGFRPTRIVGEPDTNDALGLVDDLDTICAIVDPIIAAIGDYAAENFHGIDRALFRDQLRAALDGNATFDIEAAGRTAMVSRADAEAEIRAVTNAKPMDSSLVFD
jgi:hypothetical protein